MSTESKKIKSVCPYCGVGCGIIFETSENKVTKVSGDKEHPANFGRLCTKGNTCAQALRESGRLETPFFRGNRSDVFVPTTMETAIQKTAEKLKDCIDKYGPDSFAFYVSGQMSMEAQYLANKLAKGFIGTNNIESNSRLCMASAGAGYKLSLGSDAPPGSYDDFDKTNLFFVIGSNMADCHPILFLRMMDRVKEGAKVIVVDPRRNTTAEKASLYLQIQPGTDIALLNGILHLLLAKNQIDYDFIAKYTEGWENMPSLLASYTPHKVAQITGICESDIQKAAEWIGSSKNWITCWTMGINQSTHGTWSTNAICNLHLATGAICRPGAGPFSLTGQPNAMGGREMGYMGAGLPGQRSLLQEHDRNTIETLWKIPPGSLHTRLGNGTIDLFEQMSEGKIKACWIICTNPVASVANRNKIIQALQKAELVISQDAFFETETNQYADILLPGALWAEAEGVMVNSERNLTLMQKAIHPPGEARADWQIITQIACAMGYHESFPYTSAEEVFEEIKLASNFQTGYDLRGITYGKLAEVSIQWPCGPNSNHTRNPVRYLNQGIHQALLTRADGSQPEFVFATPSGKAQFLAREHLAPAEMPNKDFPFILNTGRLQHQWHTLTKTGKIPTLNKLNPGPFVEIHPEDAQTLGIKEKDLVEIRSIRGFAQLPAEITPRVLPGNCFTPFHWNDVFGTHLAINAVTNDAIDPISQQPEFKYCAVALSKVPQEAKKEFRLKNWNLEMTSSPSPKLPQTQSLNQKNSHIEIDILWASQTGNSESYANQCAQRFLDLGCKVNNRSMDTFSTQDFEKTKNLLLLASTFGDGEPPDNGKSFWSSLNQSNHPSLDHIRYSILALGDSNYQQFCGFGKNLDTRLNDLGARVLVPRVDCEPDYTEQANDWYLALLQALEIKQENSDLGTPQDKNFQDKVESPSSTSGRLGKFAKDTFTKNNPLPSRLLLNKRLNLPGSNKEVRQFSFDISDPQFMYQAGDALGVWPENNPAMVTEILKLLSLSPDYEILHTNGQNMAISDALAKFYDIFKITPLMLELFVKYHPQTELSSIHSQKNLSEINRWISQKSLVDRILEYPTPISPSEFIGALRPLQPRLYSISSSPLKYPQEVHLTVSIVRYISEGRPRGGVCSTFLADRGEKKNIPIFVQKSPYFRPPQNPHTPMIMVGPGTGIAPFRAFLQERQALGAPGKNWLFFGEQTSQFDFYYQEELKQFQKEGYLTRLDLAFSRDQLQKIYVQDRLLENGAEVWAWLEEGAHFYVCGDASKMAKDVDTALRKIVEKHGGLDHEKVDRYMMKLNQEKRYVRDVY